ncbi:S24 family peptidase [Chitinimonas sp. BJB300]|uniref:S24 family peptidase n=1 Tax=Chitinimonas sp. BJB300 TaxID=1559339 RepID=UPI0013040347|nr:S24 family peptidase [Chitinimonas sp. BJB300]
MDIYQIRLQNLQKLAEGQSRKDVAERLEMGYSQLSQYVGKNPAKNIGSGVARKAEIAYGKPHGWMDILHPENLEAPLEPGNIATRPRPVSIYDDRDELDEDEIEVVALRLKMSAGNGSMQWAVDDEGKRHRYSKRWASTLNIRYPEKLTTVVVEGDSMEPRIPNGASVTIYTHVTSIRSGEIFAVDFLGEFYIKRLFKEPDGIRMVSDSPDKHRYPDRVIQAEHAHSLRILGAIVDVKFRPVERPWW